MHERNLGHFLDGHKAEVILGLSANVDERTQAVILAEVAARVFVTRGSVLDLSYRIESDEGRLLAVAPQTQRFLGGADRARLSAVLVHDNFRLLAGGAETVANEIHFSL